jgi:NTP pyrophosphatase (non-canonical NTP hydrolase)
VNRVSQLTFTEAQAAAWANKVRRGFNTTDVGEEFCLLVAEVGEAVDAWRENRSPPPGRFRRAFAWLRIRPLPPVVIDVRPVRLEVADAIVFLLSIAQMTGFDAGAAVAEKLRINEARTYRSLPGGAHVQDRRA